MAALAVALDLALGDPSDRFHPVRWLGMLIGWLERKIYVTDSGYAGGATLAAVTLLVTSGVIALVLRVGRKGGAAGRLLAGAIVVYFTVSLRQLTRRALEVERHLETGHIADARRGVSAIVGRDTGALDACELTRATVESVAENTSDGVVAPLFYALTLGPLGAALYRAANTLDSMVGYRDDRYARFGWASARLDDLANLVPARLTSCALVAASWLSGGDAARAARTAIRDAGKHESPNAGWLEAAMAGALGVRLGGTNYYRGVPADCVHLGEATMPLEPAHIAGAVRYARLAGPGFLAVSAAVLLFATRRKR